MGKKSKPSTSTQKTEPWSAQQPYLLFGFDEAKNLYNSGGPQYYPNATYTPFSQQSEMGLDMLQNRALYGSPLERGAQGYATNMLTGRNPLANSATRQLRGTLHGRYMNNNPYLDRTFDNAANRVTEHFNDAVMPGLNATFAGAGGSGSGIHRELATDAAGELSQTLGNMATDIYGGNYQQERNRQLQAAGLANDQQRTGLSAAALAPGLANIDYNNIGKLLQVGGAVEGKAGEVLGDSMNRFNYYQNLPEQNLQNYMAAIQGHYGGTTSRAQTNPMGSPISGALGGALAGGSLGALTAAKDATGLAAVGGWPFLLGGAALGLLGG